MAKKVADGRAIRTRRAAAASVAVLALGAGTFLAAPANTTAPDSGRGAREALAVEAGLREGPGRLAVGGDPSGSALVQSATDSRSPSIVGDGQEAGGGRVAGGTGALGQSATDSRSPTLE
jgi:hypothetical protein